MNQTIFPRTFYVDKSPSLKISFYFKDREPIQVFIRENTNTVSFAQGIQERLAKGNYQVFASQEANYSLAIGTESLEYFDVVRLTNYE